DSDHDPIDHVRVAAALALERFAIEALAVQTARDLAQRQFTERGKIARLEKILQRIFDLRLRINLPLAQSFAQSFHGHVDVNDLIGAREERIGHRLAHVDAGDAPHHRVQTFDVLDVHGGNHVDAGADDLLDVLVALFVAGAGGVGVRELIDDYDIGLARDDCIDVHLFQRNFAVRNLAARNDLEVANPLLRLAAVVRFNEAKHDIHSPIAELIRLLEHPVCLAYARGGADINFEPSPLRLGHKIEKSFGLKPFFIAHSSPGSCSATTPRGAIEGQVQQQDVHPRLAEDSRRSRPRVLGNQLPDLIFAHAARVGNTRHLEVGGGGTYLGIEAAARSRHQVHWNLARIGARIALDEVLQPRLDRVDQRLVGGPEIRAARVGGVVALVTPGGRPALK